MVIQVDFHNPTNKTIIIPKTASTWGQLVSGTSASASDDTDTEQDDVASQGRSDDSDTEEAGVISDSGDGHTSAEEEGFTHTQPKTVPTQAGSEEGSASATDATTTVQKPQVPVPRTSTRQRRKPEWHTKGDFVMSQTTSPLSDWMIKHTTWRS